MNYKLMLLNQLLIKYGSQFPHFLETLSLEPSDPIEVLEKTIGKATNRSSILSALVGNGFNTITEIDVSRIEKEASEFLIALPVFSYTYWEN